MTDSKPRYIDVVDVAKLVRGALKKDFPDVKFSVRSERSSSSAAVHVAWTDGPQQSDVEAVVSQYEGSRIDGDYFPRPVTHYLRPDGQAMVAYNPASYAVGAFEPEGEDNRLLERLMPAEVELVYFGADFVLCHREPPALEAAEMERRSKEARANRDPDELPF